MENLWQALIMGVVEGLTEFLPISSTGHMILAAKLLKMEHTEFLKTFEISIQLGAILAVVCLYWRLLFANLTMLKKILVAFIPTGVLGFTLYKVVKGYLLGSSSVVLGALFIGGVVIILLEMLFKNKPARTTTLAELSYFHAFIIGSVQALAMVPGVSRAAATILGGLFLRIERKTIVIFSFLLAIPTMSAAAAYDLLKGGIAITQHEIILLAVGFLVSFVVAIAAVKFFLRFVQTHTFIPFGVYRIVLVLVWVYWGGF